jgi:predicted PurR-regulated permease PerM
VASAIIGGAIRAVFAPVVERLARVKVRRIVSAVGLLLTLLGGVVLGISRLMPRVYREFGFPPNGAPCGVASVVVRLRC